MTIGYIAPGAAPNIRELPRRRAAETLPAQELVGHRADAQARLSGGEDHDVRTPIGGDVPEYVEGTTVTGRASVAEPARIADELTAQAHLEQVAHAASIATGETVTPEDVRQMLAALPDQMRAALDVGQERPADVEPVALADVMGAAPQVPTLPEREPWDTCGSHSPTGQWCRREHSHFGPCVGWITGGATVEQWIGPR